MPLKANYFLFLMVAAIFGGISFCILAVNTEEEIYAAFGGALLTLAAIFAGLMQFRIQSEENRSKFYLEESISGIDKAYGLLKDRNNDRVTWILAARILSRVRMLAKEVSGPAHLSVLEVHKDVYRLNFSEILFYDVKDKGAFFYGVENHDDDLDVARAFQATCEDLLNIPEAAIAEVMHFAHFPANYVDTLNSNIEDEQLATIDHFFPSLNDYIRDIRSKGNPTSAVRVYRKRA